FPQKIAFLIKAAGYRRERWRLVVAQHGLEVHCATCPDSTQWYARLSLQLNARFSSVVTHTNAECLQ
ncbi:MAG TPA: hypothetical protein VN920_04815, partial [Pyrinomonadaceae bacterium]|nr:hypothetical protein [Pyrinomonadaceae bacterium]